MPELKAVIIDFDDTLCLTEAACFELENEALVAMGKEPMDRAVHISTWGQPLFEAIRERSPGIDVEAYRESYAPIIKRYTESGKLDEIPEANYQALDELIRLGKLVMILTSRTHTEVRHLIAPDHLLSSRVKAFYYKDVMKFHKPDPRAFDELLGEYAISPQESVYVGDAFSDAIAAKQRGLWFVASLEGGLRKRDDFDGYGVDEFIDTFPQLSDAIRRIEER